MQLNRKLYFTHNLLAIFYALILVLGIFLYTEHRSIFDKTWFLYAFFILFFLINIHYQTALEVEIGLKAGKIVSRVIAYLLLICFPVGTCIGVFILFLTSEAKWQSNGVMRPKSKLYNRVFQLRILCIYLVNKAREFFTIPKKGIFNRKLALYLRVSIVWQTIALVGLFILKADVIFANFFAVLFFPCIWGMTVYYCYQYSLSVLSGEDQARWKIRKFSMVLFILYGMSILIIPLILIFWVKTSDKFWQSQKDIYLGKFY